MAEAVRIYWELWQNMYLILGLWGRCPQLCKVPNVGLKAL